MILLCIFFAFSCRFIPQRKPFTGINHSPFTPGIIYSCDLWVLTVSPILFLFPWFPWYCTLLILHIWFLQSTSKCQKCPLSSFFPPYLPLVITFTPKVSNDSALSLVLSSPTQLGKRSGIGICLPSDHQGCFTRAAWECNPHSFTTPFTSLPKMLILSSLKTRHKHKNVGGESSTGVDSRDWEVR